MHAPLVSACTAFFQALNTVRYFHRSLDRHSLSANFTRANTFGQGRLSARLPLNGKSLGGSMHLGLARAAASPQRWIPPLHWVTN